MCKRYKYFLIQSVDRLIMISSINYVGREIAFDTCSWYKQVNDAVAGNYILNVIN